VHVTFGEYMADLKRRSTPRTNWQLNMLMLAGRVSQGTLNELSRMGPEGAPLVADLVNRSDAELDKMDGLFALRSKEATDAWGAQLTMAQPVLAEIARKGGQGASDAAAAALRNGTATLASIAAQWGVSIASGVNPILTGLGKPRITTSGWDATGFMGPVQLANKWVGGYTGDGGKFEPKGVVHGGEFVFTKEQTSRAGVGNLQSWAQSLNGYAGGGFVTSADVPKPASTAPAGPPYSTVADAAMQKVYDETRAWMDANMGAAFTGMAGSGVQRWLPMVISALNMMGQPEGLAQTVLRRMNQESGGNPTAINRTDINWQRGTPSVGLMQVIGPTYRAYKDARRDVGPYAYGSSEDPLSNTLASMHYAISRYGSLSAAYNKAGGYDQGGLAMGPGYLAKGTVRPERVLSPRQTEAFESWMGRGGFGGGAAPIAVAPPQVTVHFHVDGEEFRGMTRTEITSAIGSVTRGLSAAGVR
jgi:hypothetical protein